MERNGEAYRLLGWRQRILKWLDSETRGPETSVPCGMARSPQYRQDEDLPPSLEEVKATIKRMQPKDRATLLAWLALYYDDQGELYPPAQTKRRDKATLGGQDYWLLKIPSK